MKKFLLKAIGLCGVDNSIHPNQLIMYSTFYPFIEFGILFRPDKEGRPRYPTMDWVRKLSVAVQNYNNNNNLKINTNMKLAAHLCERRVDEVLKYGDDTFIKQLIEWGFQRVQINATAVNGVDTSVFDNNDSCSSSSLSSDHCSSVDFVTNFLSVVSNNTNIEFIIQKNNETQPLWEGIINKLNDNNSSATTTAATTGTSTSTCTYNNISFLLDESKGTGVLPMNGCWPSIPKSLQNLKSTCNIGYAGGIGPLNVKDVLENITESKQSNNNEDENENENTTDTDTDTIFWIDMESKLRSIKNDKDVFDLDKCYQVIYSVCELINTSTNSHSNSNLVLLDSSSSSSTTTTTLIN